jgi:SAM-dependent methyltransferase
MLFDVGLKCTLSFQFSARPSVKLVHRLTMTKVFYHSPDQQVEFLKQILHITPDSKGLDIGCAVGVQLELLQKYCPDTHGIDILEYTPNLKNFIQKDIFKDSLQFDNDLDFAYCLAPYFGNDWNNLGVLFANLKKYLKPNGLFLLDLFDFNAKKVGLKFQTYEVYPKKILLTTYHRQEKVYTGKRIIKFSDWTEKYQDLYWRVFDRDELIQIAMSQGFEIVAEYGSFDLESKKLYQPAWNVTNDRENRVILLFKMV